MLLLHSVLYYTNIHQRWIYDDDRKLYCLSHLPNIYMPFPSVIDKQRQRV